MDAWLCAVQWVERHLAQSTGGTESGEALLFCTREWVLSTRGCNWRKMGGVVLWLWHWHALVCCAKSRDTTTLGTGVGDSGTIGTALGFSCVIKHTLELGKPG